MAGHYSGVGRCGPLQLLSDLTYSVMSTLGGGDHALKGLRE